MDEPFSSLDALTREDLQDQLKLPCANRIFLFLVTHSIEEAVFWRKPFLLCIRMELLLIQLTTLNVPVQTGGKPMPTLSVLSTFESF